MAKREKAIRVWGMVHDNGNVGLHLYLTRGAAEADAAMSPNVRACPIELRWVISPTPRKRAKKGAKR